MTNRDRSGMELEKKESTLWRFFISNGRKERPSKSRIDVFGISALPRIGWYGLAIMIIQKGKKLLGRKCPSASRLRMSPGNRR